ncbi:hypothetical protein QC334_34750 [Streptomyces sp. DH18]|uniref:hypothetical protein n=1 Tax=Streptomyces sp. DH18 TaxID=3040126 RepID=UPI00244325D6|nr:hypothetical protein [Streptomyces sp. DH18]MDG9687831.1 hypothetical protein [Streptomyces sp. DH18]
MYLAGRANYDAQSHVQTQREWHATYRALAAPRPRHAAELRRRLLHLAVRIHWHPWWSTPAGWSPAARAELRRLTDGDRQTDADAA